MAIYKIAENEFAARVEGAKSPVIVDFYADWCGPCKMLLPILERFAEANPAVDIFEINVDDAPALSEKFGVESIPTLLLIKDGKEVKRLIGLQNEASLSALIAD